MVRREKLMKYQQKGCTAPITTISFSRSPNSHGRGGPRMVLRDSADHELFDLLAAVLLLYDTVRLYEHIGDAVT